MKQSTSENILAFLAGLALFALIFVATQQAHATGNKEPSQGQNQDQSQAQEQSSISSADANSDSVSASTSNNEGNSQSIAFSTPDDITIKRTVNPYAPSIDPSHPCALTWSAGLGLTGVGVSGGKAYIDEACNTREWARLMFQMGARDAAIYVMCSQPQGADVPDCAGIRDYNKEMKLLTLGHDQLVEENAELRNRIDFLLSERLEDQAECKESVNRVGNELEKCLKK